MRNWEKIVLNADIDPPHNEHLRTALKQLFKNDAALFATGSSERSIAHRLAVYLEARYPDYHVDCEYNRYKDKPKSINVLLEKATREIQRSPELLQETILGISKKYFVYPDIVIHERSKCHSNLMIVELKLKGRGSQAWDKIKLEHFTEPEGDYAYQYGVLLEIDYREDAPNVEIEIYPRTEK